MAHYDGVNGVARKNTKQYDGVAGIARKTKKAYDGVNGIARLTYTGLYTWAKYTSRVVSSAYGDYTYISDGLTNRIWPLDSESLDYLVYVGSGYNGDEYKFVTYDSIVYDRSTGQISLTGKQEFYVDENTLIDEDVAEEELAGRYVYLDGDVRRIIGYEAFESGGRIYTLKVGRRYIPGDRYYTYAYYYVEDVQSDNPNAYPEGSTAGYTSTSSNDIRTVYVRVERD